MSRNTMALGGAEGRVKAFAGISYILVFVIGFVFGMIWDDLKQNKELLTKKEKSNEHKEEKDCKSE